MNDSRAAIVLAGGRSERFGDDKRQALIDGRSLLDHVLNAVEEVTDFSVVVVAPGETPTGISRRVRVTHDRVAFAGPLAGLSAGLGMTFGTTAVLVVGADMPWLRPDVLRLLLDRAVDPEGPAAWTLEGPDPTLVGPLPFAGRTSQLRDAARQLVKTGHHSLRSLMAELGAGRIATTDWRALDPDGLTLRDVDRPEDLGP